MSWTVIAIWVEREDWKKGFRRSFPEQLKTIVIQMVAAVIVSALAAIGSGLEPTWTWIAIGVGGTFLIMLPFNLSMTLWP